MDELKLLVEMVASLPSLAVWVVVDARSARNEKITN